MPFTLPRLRLREFFLGIRVFQKRKPSRSGFRARLEELEPRLAPAAWTLAAPMAMPRGTYASTLLQSGKLLVIGGESFSGPGPSSGLAQCELYDSASNTWSAAGSLLTAGFHQDATLLPSGKVLLTGGLDTNGQVLASAELYDPITNTWSSAANMSIGRNGHTATLLANGLVLVTGGDGPLSVHRVALATAELYNPATNSWSAAPPMKAARSFHTATLLPSGRVLVAAGFTTNLTGTPLSSSELYDSLTNTWSAAGSMVAGRAAYAAFLLNNGKVFVEGGTGGGSNFLKSTEVYDPATNKWTAAAFMAVSRIASSATQLSDGAILVAGGVDVTGKSLATVQRYDPVQNSWTSPGDLNIARGISSMTALANGAALVAGGADASHTLASVELFKDSAPPKVAVNPISRLSGLGGLVPFTFQIKLPLGGSSKGPVTYDVFTTDDTAKAGVNFVGITAGDVQHGGTVTFAKGATVASVTVYVIAGSIPITSSPKTFTVNIADPLFSTVALASGTGTIIPQLPQAVPVPGAAPAPLAIASFSVQAGIAPASAAPPESPSKGAVTALNFVFANAASESASETPQGMFDPILVVKF